jgi:copper resistance protein B
MLTKTAKIMVCLLISLPAIAKAHDDMDMGSQIFHMIKLETDVGGSTNGTLSKWDLDGWIGTDYNKLWLKSEGESLDGKTPDKAEYWAMYSHNISTFWDAQIGLRYDDKPNSTTYFTAGFQGLAPYSFETEAHLFISDNGYVSARIREKNDFLITQRLITQPYAEINLSAQDVTKQKTGAGFTDGNIGIQTRYEFTRKFAPYIDLRYERKFGETSTIAKKFGETQDDAIASIGLRLMF